MQRVVSVNMQRIVSVNMQRVVSVNMQRVVSVNMQRVVYRHAKSNLFKDYSLIYISATLILGLSAKPKDIMQRVALILNMQRVFFFKYDEYCFKHTKRYLLFFISATCLLSLISFGLSVNPEILWSSTESGIYLSQTCAANYRTDFIHYFLCMNIILQTSSKFGFNDHISLLIGIRYL